MKEAAFRPSKPLRQLAEITDFNLFVSTTFDSLLEKAINEVRFGDAPGTLSIAYSPKRVDDLPSSKEKLDRPTVYYLMGKLSATGSYVISDEDLLEYVCDLQSPARRPERLFDELKKNHLLILGEDYSDWLVRIFLRTAKGGQTVREPRASSRSWPTARPIATPAWYPSCFISAAIRGCSAPAGRSSSSTSCGSAGANGIRNRRHPPESPDRAATCPGMPSSSAMRGKTWLPSKS